MFSSILFHKTVSFKIKTQPPVKGKKKVMIPSQNTFFPTSFCVCVDFSDLFLFHSWLSCNKEQLWGQWSNSVPKGENFLPHLIWPLEIAGYFYQRLQFSLPSTAPRTPLVNGKVQPSHRVYEMEETGLTRAIRQKKWCERQREQTTTKAGAIPTCCNYSTPYFFSACSEEATKS